MKSVLQYCVLLLSLSAFTTTSTLAQVVLDSDGEPIVNRGGPYYIMPVLRGPGGGLVLAETGDETCPLTVVQARQEVIKGIPARISSPYLVLFISTSFLVQIDFIIPSELSTCLPSPAPWKVEQESQAVKISMEGSPPLMGPFRIQNVNDVVGSTDYKIQYCEQEGDSDFKCKDLGISIDNDNNRRLVVSHENPLVVRFVKADKVESAGRRSIIKAVA